MTMINIFSLLFQKQGFSLLDPEFSIIATFRNLSIFISLSTEKSEEGVGCRQSWHFCFWHTRQGKILYSFGRQVVLDSSKKTRGVLSYHMHFVIKTYSLTWLSCRSESSYICLIIFLHAWSSWCLILSSCLLHLDVCRISKYA